VPDKSPAAAKTANIININIKEPITIPAVAWPGFSISEQPKSQGLVGKEGKE